MKENRTTFAYLNRDEDDVHCASIWAEDSLRSKIRLQTAMINEPCDAALVCCGIDTAKKTEWKVFLSVSCKFRSMKERRQFM